jgi:hypothetical protein
MIGMLLDCLKALRPAFSREAAYRWFVIALFGFLLRNDLWGVSSIVRALALTPGAYPCLLHFFHSSAWDAETLLAFWRGWLLRQGLEHRVNERIVLIGDHTKTPKDGRKIPDVETLHQDSETASKPSYFRGHHWGLLALWTGGGQRDFATPLWAEIHPRGSDESRVTRMVAAAAAIAKDLGQAYLVLDAFFASGPAFLTAAALGGLHILTRAKSNTVAYKPAPAPAKPRRGRKRLYGKKIKLYDLFDARAAPFQTVRATVYGTAQDVRILTLDLLWKPTKGMLRFILVESARGRMVLITSDLTLAATDALEMYCARTRIETLFNSIKNLLGAMAYHFWSRYLPKASRRPLHNQTNAPVSSRPDKTRTTQQAIAKFFAVHIIALGLLQVLACRCGAQIHRIAHCWMRTPCGKTPSESYARAAVTNLWNEFSTENTNNEIVRIIRQKQKRAKTPRLLKKAA